MFYFCLNHVNLKPPKFFTSTTLICFLNFLALRTTKFSMKINLYFTVLTNRTPRSTVEFAYISTSGGLQKSADIRELPM